jgi:predicted nucleotidyltransferase
MPHDTFIGSTMWQRIERELDAIENTHQVRILLAIESGSRAWRFPSLDSDYDVRFIYAHSRDAYLSIEGPRDVIECPLEGALDINGWDIRKALQLLVRSNAVLVEWLSSPVRYRDDGTASAQILGLTRETCHLPALTYHYDRLARRNFDDILSTTGPVRLKTYCYALRPALAILWMRGHGEPPPMDLPALLKGVVVADVVQRAIAALVERKALATEQGMTPRVPELDTFLAEALSEPTGRFTLPDRAAVVSRANALFSAIILGATSDRGAPVPPGR